MAVPHTHTHIHVSHWPALIDVVNSQSAQKENDENSYEHVVNGPDVADLEQFAEKEEERHK